MLATTLETRWMIRRDVPAVLSIEADCGGGWDEARFLATMARRECIGMVAAGRKESWADVRAFAVYELCPDCLHLLRFGALDAGAGSALLAKLLYKVGRHYRRWIGVPFAGAADRMGGVWVSPADLLAVFSPLDVPRVRREWQTTDVRALCGAGHCPHLPILADALEDAGCADGGLLTLFRADGPVAGIVYQELRDGFLR